MSTENAMHTCTLKESFLNCAVGTDKWSVTIHNWTIICVITPRLGLDVGLAVIIP
jgi:hypothetical protein